MRLYTDNQIDLFIVYVAPEDAWYIIPVTEISSQWRLYLYPHEPSRDHKDWERYREAWRLLGRPLRDPLPRQRSESVETLRGKLLRALALQTSGG